jgi:hypothetical protein
MIQMLQVSLDSVFTLGNNIGPHDQCFIVGFSFPLFNADGSPGTGANAGTKTITEEVPYEPGFAVYKLQSPLRASISAGSAAIAAFFIYGYDIAFHIYSLYYHYRKLLCFFL